MTTSDNHSPPRRDVIAAGAYAATIALIASAPGQAISQTIPTGDRVILGHQVHGAGPERVIVLHDWMGDSSNYDAARPWLDGDRHTYAFADVRGYGRSSQFSGAFSSEEIAADILALADHLNWPRFHLVGHSMNGMAGFRLLMRDWQSTRRIKSYVAVTPVTPRGYPASGDDRMFLASAIDDDAVAQMAFAALTGNRLSASWGRAKTLRNRATSQPETLRGYYDMWLGEDFSAAFEAARIGAPVLVIGGRNDLPGFQENQYQATLATWLSNVRFEYVADAGHYPMQETPILFASLIETHFAMHA